MEGGYAATSSGATAPDELAAGFGERASMFGKEGLTFDDVLLVPGESSVLPQDVSTRTRLMRRITLEIPVVSAAMDTVTGARLERDPRLSSSRVGELVDAVADPLVARPLA